MATARQLPSGNWRCQAYDGTDAAGRIKRKSFTAKTKSEAEQKAAVYKLARKKMIRLGIQPKDLLAKDVSDILYTFRALASLADQRQYIALLLTTTSGLRRGDLCKLKWSDVDFRKNCLYVQKETETVIVHMAPLVMQELHRLHQEEFSRKRIKDARDIRQANPRPYATILDWTPDQLTRKYNYFRSRLRNKMPFQNFCGYYAQGKNTEFIPTQTLPLCA